MSGQAAFDELVRRAALCERARAEGRKLEETEETELHGVEEGEDETSVEGGDGVDSEEELATPDWRVRAGPRNKPTQKETIGKSTKQHTCRSESGAHIA